jgi:predicted RNase H-like HicB family nuclease
MDLTLTAVFEEIPQAEGGGFVAYTEELPGAITQGETLEEARENLRDAIEILLEANRELAKQPRPGAELHAKKSRYLSRDL